MVARNCQSLRPELGTGAGSEATSIAHACSRDVSLSRSHLLPVLPEAQYVLDFALDSVYDPVSFQEIIIIKNVGQVLLLLFDQK